MKPLRDWNHNGKDDMFDYAMDKYVFDHTFGKKDGTQTGKQDKTKPTHFKPDYIPDDNMSDADGTRGLLGLVFLVLALIAAAFIGGFITMFISNFCSTPAILMTCWIFFSIVAFLVLAAIIIPWMFK